jgi:hypothetical protein
MSALFPAAVDRDTRIWGDLAHVQLERIPVVSRQLCKLADPFAGRAVKSLLLNGTGAGCQLNNRVPAMGTGEGDSIQFHSGVVSYWSDDYSQAERQL